MRDRRQEIVIIGIDLDKSLIIKKFDQCLLTDQEISLGQEGWNNFSDPFPIWSLVPLEEYQK